MGRNQASQVTVLHYHKAPASANQQVLVDEVLQAQMGFDGGEIAIHHIGHLAVAQSFCEFHLSVAGAGRIEQEPANEGQPQAAESFSGKELEEPAEDEEEGDGLANAGGDAVERSMLWVYRQIAARNTRPPSRGYPGIMLKAASTRLM